MTAQSLYNQLVQGTISKEKFLYEVRRDPSLTMITKFNSIEDTIQILKKRSIISEVKDGKYKADKTNPLPEIESFTIDMVSPYEYSKGINYELEIEYLSVGQNPQDNDVVLRAQRKVLKNLTSDPYYYTKKKMSDEEKKQEKSNLRPEELKKDNFKAPNQTKVLKENSECGDCQRENVQQSESGEYENGVASGQELDMDAITPQQREILGRIIEDWGLTEHDLEDSDVMDEIIAELNRLTGEEEIDEAIALKDKAGNVTYAKDSSEASSISNSARMKGVQLTQSNI